MLSRSVLSLCLFLFFSTSSIAKESTCEALLSTQNLLSELHWLAQCRSATKISSCTQAILPKNLVKQRAHDALDDLNETALNVGLSVFLSLSKNSQKKVLCALPEKQKEEFLSLLQQHHQKEFPFATAQHSKTIALVHSVSLKQYSYPDPDGLLKGTFKETQTDLKNSVPLLLNDSSDWPSLVKKDKTLPARLVLATARAACQRFPNGDYCEPLKQNPLIQRGPAQAPSVPPENRK